jgi:ATP-dependent helicase Lhr and Lhr-like helicase
MSFDLLSEPVRRYVRDQRWESLRPIQAAAIEKILKTDDNYILASKTASGKTEAAFLPIISLVNFTEPGVQVLYISPLIALINDQFNRVEELCKYLDVPVTKWHGEANKTLKEKIVKHPEGILLITPESIEAMFVNKPYHVKSLFSNLKFVVIDEIHSFIGTDRGTQLQSILSRIGDLNPRPFRIIGLSATIGDYQAAKQFTGNELKTKVLLDKTPKEINACFRYIPSETQDLPGQLLEDLYDQTKDHKVLIFPNSRGKTEEVAVRLKKISERKHGHSNYFSHHSSIDRAVRESVEYFAKNNRFQNFCISCTSTLELGIDIGTVDAIVQIDATHSISSMIQRVGRSGRKEGQKSNLFLYATNPWSLLQSLACWLLYKEGFIEPPQVVERPYDILLHQALSITKSKSGINIQELVHQLKSNFAFHEIEELEISELIEHLIEIDFLEKLYDEVIIGLAGEKVVNSRDFYAMFKTEEHLKVVHSGNTIGEIPYSPQIIEDENILLAARIWKIKFVDLDAKRIEVVPARDGKSPKFSGSGGLTHRRVREKMLDLLYNKDEFDVLDEAGAATIEIMRRDFAAFNIQDLSTERPLNTSGKYLELYTFTGTMINRSIQFLLSAAGLKNNPDDSGCPLEIDATASELENKWNELGALLPEIAAHISAYLQEAPELINFSKWGPFLPLLYQVKLLQEKYFDFPGAEEMLSLVKPVANK